MAEEEELRLFLGAYERVTGEMLKCVPSRGESPDFVCVRLNGKEVGVELTRITRSPCQRFAERVLLRRGEQESQEAIEEMFRVLEHHDTSRRDHYAPFEKTTILVMQLFDCGLASLLALLDKSLQDDFSQNGFLEVWLADYTGVEAYGDVELFGLKPLQWWGYHERQNPGRKPYG